MNSLANSQRIHDELQSLDIDSKTLTPRQTVLLGQISMRGDEDVDALLNLLRTVHLLGRARGWRDSL